MTLADRISPQQPSWVRGIGEGFSASPTERPPR